MNIETGSDPRGLWRLRSVHRLVGLHREAGVSGIMMRERPRWDQDAGEDQHAAPEFFDQLGVAAAVST